MNGFRRGSAILIVLGMMTFVVVSAIGFAAYMRYARMPSSYLRRTSSSRLLVKAALAEAISEIDMTIGDSTWPGKSGTAIKNYQRLLDDEERTPVNIYDTWMDRCYVGTNALLALTESIDGQALPTTVATLTTEALAYLPPGLINEARYYSRRVPSARWHSLGFDSGRFAFFAIDVSDFFDVNRTRCYIKSLDGGQPLYGRNSSDDGRISLAYAFENPSHDDYTVDPVEWDRFVDLYRGSGNVPFISLADLNLAVNKQGLPAELSPFCRFIKSGENFVPDNSDNDPGAFLLRHLNFVTDSWYLPSNRVANVIDLSREADQPFYSVGQIDKPDANSQLSLSTLLGTENNFSRYFASSTSRISNDPEYIQLCDYLDANSVPATLALPTYERTPMITGVALEGGLEFELVKEEETEETGKVVRGPDGQNQFLYLATTHTVVLKDRDGLSVAAGTVYPFKHARGTEQSYSLEAVATIALVPECNPATDAEGLLRCRTETPPPTVVSCNRGWQDVKASWNTDSLAASKTVAFVCRSAAKNVPYQKEPKDEQEAIADEDVIVSFASLGEQKLASKLPATDIYNEHTCTFRSVKRMKWETAADGSGGSWALDTSFKDPTPREQRIGILPSSKDLTKNLEIGEVADGLYVPTVQVWARIYESGGSKTSVDLVPACWKDDPKPYTEGTASGSAPFPLLRFRLSQGFKLEYDKDALTLNEEAEQAKFSPQMYLTDDPRFNYAPENFIALDDVTTEMKDAWWQHHRAGDGDRDGDIFMATSDAGYLQSPYELANIVAVSRGTSSFESWGCTDGDGYNGRARTSFSECPADKAMWRTYSQYDNGYASGEIDELGFLTGMHGTRVSPYAQRKEILMAALANTPLDWWAASTNKDVNAIAHASADAADEWSFNSVNSRTQFQIDYDELEQIALNLKATFRNANVNLDWRRQFDTSSWWNSAVAAGAGGASHSKLCGQQLQHAKLHAIDRKFLHGFWKGCFDNRQQLFMIFVRAEPMMMGGGALGQTPPQLGARAMALVWRDPNKPTGTVSANGRTGVLPHRTRILFYRQFD